LFQSITSGRGFAIEVRLIGVREKEYSPMTANEAAIRKAYQVAEEKDVVGWINSFTKDGTFHG
jgi:hypothetical protein